MMKSKFWAGMGFLAMTALVFSQQAKPGVPAFSTAEQVAIQACENKKQEAKKAFDAAQQVELSVLRDFETKNPGFTVNQQTLVVEPVAAKVEPKAEPKKE